MENIRNKEEMVECATCGNTEPKDRGRCKIAAYRICPECSKIFCWRCWKRIRKFVKKEEKELTTCSKCAIPITEEMEEIKRDQEQARMKEVREREEKERRYRERVLKFRSLRMRLVKTKSIFKDFCPEYGWFYTSELVDHAARKLGVNPGDIRIKNLICLSPAIGSGSFSVALLGDQYVFIDLGPHTDCDEVDLGKILIARQPVTEEQIEEILQLFKEV